MKVRWLIAAMILWASSTVRADPGTSSSAEADELVFYRKGDPERGREKFILFQCVKCHRVQSDLDLPEASAASLAPILGSWGHSHSPDELAQAILTPAHKPNGDFGFAMPDNYQEKISPQDLIDLVTYLRTAQE